MNRPTEKKYRLCTMGWEKCGKSNFAVSLFDGAAVDVDPERIIYFDNHGSTESYNLHQYTAREPYGVRHIPADKPEKLVEWAQEIRGTIARKKEAYYQAIVIDDICEQAALNIRKKAGDGKMTLQQWGEHGAEMVTPIRLLHPKATNAHLVIVARAGWMGDPREDRSKDSMVDDRAQKVRVKLQGQFGEWFPYQMELIAYQYFERKGGARATAEDFKMLLVPQGDIMVANYWHREWIRDHSLPEEISDPSFTKLVQLLDRLQHGETQTQEEEGE